MDFQQSMTYINLQNAYDFELQTSTKYEMFSITAGKEVYIEISNIFDTTSRNGRFIAERFRNLLYGRQSNTTENLLEASSIEEYAQKDLYLEYSRIATEEGYDNIASLFNGVANIKLNHNLIFQSVAEEMQNDELFCKKEEALWICLGCGNILSGLCAPEICPICGYPQGYYKLQSYY